MNRAKRLTIYAVAVAIFAIVLVFMPKGGVGHPEIEAKLLITVLGLDKTEEGYHLSATAVMPEEGQNGTTKTLTIGADGDSVSNALEEIMIKMGKPLELGLCGLVIVGDNFGEESVEEHFNYMLASGKVIPGAHLLFSPQKSAKETLELSNSLSDATSNNLSELIEYNSKSNNVPTLTVLEFLSLTANKSRGAYMPCISIEKKKIEEKVSEGSKQTQSEQKEESEITSISEVALFCGGVKKKVMNKRETLGFTWMDKRSSYGLVTLHNLKLNGEEVGKIHCQMTRKDYSLETSPNDDSAEVKIKVTLSHEDASKLNEKYRKFNLKGETIAKAVEKGYSEQIKEEVENAIAVMKEINCDAIGIEDNAYRFHNSEYSKLKDKGNFFKNCEIKVMVEVEFI